MSPLRFRGEQVLVDERQAPWPTCGWTDPQEGWQRCLRDAHLAQFDEEGTLLFRCAHHRIDDSHTWYLAELEEVAL